jgi:hypothetical protein
MKQNYIEVQVKNQIQKSIQDAFSGSNQKILNGKVIRPAVPNHPFRQLAEKVGSLAFCKGPPGRSRSPGIENHLFPEHPPDHYTANEKHLKTNLKPIISSPLTVRKRAEIHLNTESQIVIKIQILKPFNFFIMKKQILFLAFFVLAVVANVSQSFGQAAVPGTTARVVPCADPANPNPLTPVAGIPYRYEADVTPVGTAANKGTAHWFVTTVEEFIAGGSLTTVIQSVGGSYLQVANTLGDILTDDVTNPNPQGIDITWKTEGLSLVDYTAGSESPLFVGVMYTAPGDVCDNNNIQVWRIEPIIAFSLDIINVAETIGTPNTYAPGTWDTDMPQCFANVFSATYDYTADAVKMDYGVNTMFFEVIAANFSTSFDFTLQLTGLSSDGSGAQTADIYWGYTAAGATNSIEAGVSDATWTMAAADAITALTSELNTSEGVSIYIKVVVHNNGFEGLVDTPITLAVDGTDSADNDDVAATAGCPDELAYADDAVQTLQKRPTINNPTPTPFETKEE